MVLDLSYLSEQPSEAIRQAVETQVLIAITNYLNEVADTMEANNIECLNVPTLRGMAEQFSNRINDGETENN